MKSDLAKGLGLSLWLVSALSFAQEIMVSDVTVTRGQGWSALAGETVGAGETVLLGQLGFPGLSASLLHGVAESLDVGGQLGFQYSYEGLVSAFAPGLTFQGLLRYQLVDGDRVDLALTSSPGFLVHFPPAGTLVSLTLPVGVVAGIPIGSALMVNLGLEARLIAGIGAFGGVVLPIMVGGGAEYFLSNQFALNFDTRMGPAISALTTFAFEASVGVAYKL